MAAGGSPEVKWVTRGSLMSLPKVIYGDRIRSLLKVI